MDKNKILEEAYIPEEEWEFCYISEDGLIFRPIYDRDTQEMLETGKEYYDRYMANKDNPVEPPIDETANKISVLLNELSEGLLEAELRAVESEAIINETSNYVLDLDERLTNLELSK